MSIEVLASLLRYHLPLLLPSLHDGKCSIDTPTLLQYIYVTIHDYPMARRTAHTNSQSHFPQCS